MIGLQYDPNKETQRKLQKLREKLAEARKAVRDQSPAMKRAAIFLDQWVQGNIRSEGGKVGGWEPFKYGGRILEGGGIDTSAKLLRDTGALALSFRPFATRKNAGIGSDLDYSLDHDEGIGVPQRRLLPKKSEVRKPLRDLMDQYVKNDVVQKVESAFKGTGKALKGGIG